MKWESAKIKEVCLGIYDGPHATPPVSEDGAVFLGISNITPDGHLDLSNPKYISENDLPKWTKRVTPQAGDIVFSYEATLNLYAVIPDGFRGCLGRRMALIRPDETKVIGSFLYYYFFSDAWRKTIAENTVTGATVDRIPLIRFPDFPVSFPPIEIQTAIANTLSAYDDLIENNQKQIKLLEEAAQRLYKEWFVDLRFPGYETTPIVDGVPEGWDVQTLSQMAEVVMGQSPKSEFYNQAGLGLPFHQGVGSYGTRFVIDKTYSTSYTRIAEADSILFSVRAPVGRLNVTRNKVVIGRGLAAVNHRQGMQSYLFYLLKEHFFKDNIIGNGSIFASISKDELLGQKFMVPTDDLIEQFNAIAYSIDKKISGLADQIALLTEARDRLLPKLMNGEIEV